MVKYGDRLRSLREDRGLSQKELSERLKINRSTYARYETSTTQPDYEVLDSIANFYDVSVDYLLGRTSNFEDFHPIPLALIGDGIQKARYHHSLSLLDITRGTGIDLDTYTSYEKSGYIDGEDAKKLQRFYNDLTKTKKENNKDERDIAKRLKQFEAELENSDGLAFDGEPMSDEAKESLLESMELLFKQTQRINKKFTPKKYREDE